MASPTTSDAPDQISKAIVAFTTEGAFPESETVAALALSPETLSPAIQALEQSRSSLEQEIRQINEETKDDVASWVRNAKSLQEDIIRSKAIANDIIRQSETPDVSGKTIRDVEAKVDFLSQEVQYVQQLNEALRSIQHVNGLLSRAEQASNERRILDSLHLLEETWSAMDALPVSKTCRAVKLLSIRSFELKSGVHDVLDQVWKRLVQVDIGNKVVRIKDKDDGDAMTLSEAVIGLKAYKEVEERMVQLWHNLDVAIISPRMDLTAQSLPSIRRDDDALTLDGETDNSIESLFTDLSAVFGFLAQKLPADLLQILCSVMMEDVTTRIVKVWLDSSIPPALKDVPRFEKVIESAETFCAVLDNLGYSGFDDLKDWVSNAPMVWLAKCRETALDSVRTKLSGGIGSSKPVERVEKQMVSLAEGKELASAGGVAASANDQDWDAGWDDDEGGDDVPGDEKPSTTNSPSPTDEDDGADAWGWDDGPGDDMDDQPAEPETKPEDDVDKQPAEPESKGGDDDDGADAWGWGDEETTDDVPPPEPKPTKTATTVAPKAPAETQTREMVLKETYHVSSMPEPVLNLIFAILEDGATLTVEGNESNPVASAVSGLFGVPSLALALFRAISPYYYSLDEGGSMYLYNDAMHLAERLAEFSSGWRSRKDLSKKARDMLRLDGDVESLQSFANRAYSTEMNTQKTVVRDLMGGTYSLMQQGDMESCIDSGIARIQAMAATWDGILARSVWCQAVGSLVEALAVKIISDVMDMTSIGQDEAFGLANTIAKTTVLDDLFLPSRLAGRAREEGEVAATAQYAPSWLRLQYLLEVLQSNLNDVRYLWFESELSLYFSADEVVELMNMSFEVNARSREVVREIMQRPHPRQA
ncbi:uncharacterized protein DNG_02012 [Cephalotrichum gorgonifer]|uniref:ZW10 C-terminal helical domain-containing protein n=1 Tax=Cephalotrichum gorgonifer TaxID=2041049 RepID=A0AAE8MRN8_9PEZI|nr:uncharacterized protein DNG_02012 [Cephalotrichum gorgonifer]